VWRWWPASSSRPPRRAPGRGGSSATPSRLLESETDLPPRRPSRRAGRDAGGDLSVALARCEGYIGPNVPQAVGLLARQARSMPTGKTVAKRALAISLVRAQSRGQVCVYWPRLRVVLGRGHGQGAWPPSRGIPSGCGVTGRATPRHLERQTAHSRRHRRVARPEYPQRSAPAFGGRSVWSACSRCSGSMHQGRQAVHGARCCCGCLSLARWPIATN